MQFTTPLKVRFLSIEGPDAQKFLQGQTSCDVLALDNSRFSFGTLNTPKGRMYSLFKVIKTNNGLLLGMHESIFESTLIKLQKYAVFSKCELKEASDLCEVGIQFENLHSFDAYCEQNELEKKAFGLTSINNMNFLINQPSEHRATVWLPRSELALFTQGEIQRISSESWYVLDTQFGIPELYQESLEEFILQHLNLQELNAVSFKKGCYTGQEIIARLKYLGTQKKQMFLLKSPLHLQATPLSPVYDKESKKLGQVVRSHWSEETGFVCLAVLPIDVSENAQSLFLDEHPTHPLSIHLLDYSGFKM